AIGCDCDVCRSLDPRDKRTRPSILIQVPGTDPHPFADSVRSILVDTSTDLRMQAVANDVRRGDAILFTHTHSHQVFGSYDVRRLNQMKKSAMPCCGDRQTVETLRKMFAYIFEPPKQQGGGLPKLSLFPVFGTFTLGGLDIVPIPLFHGVLPVLGFRI